MGGRGSGRWAYRGDYIPALTVEDAVEISSTSLFRLVRPERGRIKQGSLDSTRVGPLDFEVDGTSWPVVVCLSFSGRLRSSGLSVPADVSFWLLPTELTYGGERWWFVCPACGLRCGKIYLVSAGYYRRHRLPWACRRCQGLVYPSQREGRGERGLRKLRKVLVRAGAACTDNLLPRYRPRGMHRRTFQRLHAEATRAFMSAGAGRKSAKVLRTRTLWG